MRPVRACLVTSCELLHWFVVQLIMAHFADELTSMISLVDLVHCTLVNHRFRKRNMILS
jgi:hypothetical protein